ncbi:MAG: preprotein translocase subunit SecE [Bacteroidota bacterium]
MATQTQTKSESKLGGYIQEVVKESKKVNWPKRRELIANTTLTLVASLAIALFIFGADQVISEILSFIYR